MTERVDIQTARKLPGLRMVLTSGVPGPWGEAAKGLLHAKGISYARVDQAGGMPNDELIAWTGHANAPQAIYQNERPRIGWSELIFLAERLAPDPPLIPRDPELRLEMFGLIHEIAAENGFGWSRRLMMLHQGLQLPADVMGPMRAVFERLGNSYGYTPEAGEAAPKRVEDILGLLSARLDAQQARGSGFLIGDALSAADIYWAAFAALVEPLAAEQCAMNEGLRGTYTMSDPVLRKAASPSLLEHRDRVYRAHMELPIQL